MKTIKEIFEEVSKKIDDYPASRNIDNSAIGYAAIAFRENNDYVKALNVDFPFILNSKNDTWFRKIEGKAKGYGLAIKDVKITSRKPMTMGNFDIYKASIKYIDDKTEEENIDNFWISVHNKFSIDDVINYIDKHKNKWVP
ncbi:hypothetical protein GW796_09075 [archaeon]|nr:hypothetical protein [archaeon]NCT58883.1 hypothetical protein [archaeon]